MVTESITIRGIEFGNGIPKICVPIVARTKEEIIVQTKKALVKKPDCIELRIDWYEDVKETDRVLELLKELRLLLGNSVLLFTFRSKTEGGEQEISCDEYKTLCQKVCQSGYIDLIDVEAYKAEGLLAEVVRVAHEHHVYVVASNHDFHATPPKNDIVKRLQFMDDMGADLPKIAVMPNNERDVLTLLSATLTYHELGGKKPVITMSMAGAGTISRLAGEVFGSAVTFATVGQISAPGQIPIDEVRQVFSILHEYGS